MSSAHSSFSSYDGGGDDYQNDQWLNGTIGGDGTVKSGGSGKDITFDDKYDFIDHTILGEVDIFYIYIINRLNNRDALL
jgi:hypothetical protein